MKIFSKAICMSALAFLALTACNKEKDNSVAIAWPDMAVENENGNERAYIDLTSNQGYYEAGDQLIFFNIDENTPGNSKYAMYTASSTGSNVPFNKTAGELGDCIDGFYGFYPGQVVNTDMLTVNNKATFPVASSQQYRTVNGVPAIPEGALYQCVKITGKNTLNGLGITTLNICGLLRLKLSSSVAGKQVSKITLHDDLVNLSGNVTVTIPKVNDSELNSWFYTTAGGYNPENSAYMEAFGRYLSGIGYSMEGGSHDLELRFDKEDSPILSTDANNPTVFLMVVRPGGLQPNHNTVTVEFKDGTKCTTSCGNQIKPNKIMNMSRTMSDFQLL